MAKTELRYKKEQAGTDMDKHIAEIRRERRNLAGESINGKAFMLMRHGSSTGALSIEEITIENGEIVEIKQVSPPDIPLIAVNNLERIIKIGVFRQEI